MVKRTQQDDAGKKRLKKLNKTIKDGDIAPWKDLQKNWIDLKEGSAYQHHTCGADKAFLKRKEIIY